MKTKLRDLFLIFFKIGCFTFGGGYAMLPMLQKEVVEKKNWASAEEIADYYAVGQSTPGIIAVNTATFIGYSQRGLLGAMIATLGLVLPGAVIIMVLAGGIQTLSHFSWAQKAMAGIKIAVSVLILEAMLKLRSNSLKDWPAFFIFLGVIGMRFLFPQISTPILILAAGVLGIVFYYRKGGRA